MKKSKERIDRENAIMMEMTKKQESFDAIAYRLGMTIQTVKRRLGMLGMAKGWRGGNYWSKRLDQPISLSHSLSPRTKSIKKKREDRSQFSYPIKPRKVGKRRRSIEG